MPARLQRHDRGARRRILRRPTPRPTKLPPGFTYLLIGLLLLIATRFYYAFVFLAEHHGSWSKAMSKEIDFSGWTGFVTSTPGLALHGATLAAFVFAAVSVARSARRGKKVD